MQSQKLSCIDELRCQSRASLVFMGVSTYGMYLAVPGQQVRKLLQSSRQLVPCPSLEDALNIFFGLPSIDLHIFDHEVITRFERSTGIETEHSDPSRRIMAHQRRDFARYFQGQDLDAVVRRFLGNLTTNLQGSLNCELKPSEMCDVYTFLFSHIFRAEVCALYGETMFVACPSFCEDFMRFYDRFPIISMGLPTWLCPSVYTARRQMLKNFKDWYKICQDKSDLFINHQEDVAYEPVWGSICIKRMVQRHRKLGFSDDGIASVMLGYFFVTVANSIPATIWMLLYILLDSDLTERLRAEISSSFLSPCELDTNRLTNLPLLNSVYCETLRLRVGGAVGRKCPDSDFILDGCIIKQNMPVMVSNWLGGLDSSFWNDGAGRRAGTKHPVEVFWAERFLGDRGTRLVKAGMAGNWFPFGGGTSRCPGESLARHTILGSVAMVLNVLDVQLSEPGASANVGSRHRTLPFGLHSFDKPVPFTIRMRKS
ncbi:cytochrome P450 [Diaporthe sp. PMI_573]|nr:cytochrome P450 [Diaporthaceae sp. PMI_573]